MKVIKYLFLFIFALGFSAIALAQQPNIPNTSMTQGGPSGAPSNAPEIIDVYKRENIIPTKKPIPYPYLREADMMWAKDIWRIIDLRQRMNYTFRFPEGKPIGERYSLYELLMHGVRSGEITPFSYNFTFNNPLSIPSSIKEIYNLIGADTVWANNGVDILDIGLKDNQVKGFYIQEKWFFDKQASEMKVRINVIAPFLIRNKIDPVTNQELPTLEKIIPFFAYFPQCRNLFATHPVFNPNNDAQYISYDDLFMQRRFASTISGESNEFGNRQIVDYTIGQDALMEAERIKSEIFQMEHDLWEY